MCLAHVFEFFSVLFAFVLRLWALGDQVQAENEGGETMERTVVRESW